MIVVCDVDSGLYYCVTCWHCAQIYVAGIAGARLEKVRKIINRGGGTRSAFVETCRKLQFTMTIMPIYSLSGY